MLGQINSLLDVYCQLTPNRSYLDKYQVLQETKHLLVGRWAHCLQQAHSWSHSSMWLCLCTWMVKVPFTVKLPFPREGGLRTNSWRVKFVLHHLEAHNGKTAHLPCYSSYIWHIALLCIHEATSDIISCQSLIWSNPESKEKNLIVLLNQLY